ncbi:MAG: MltA domain-containing protein [Planctomycetota bacterium]
MPRTRCLLVLLPALALAWFAGVGCQRTVIGPPPDPAYAAPLPPGASALRLITDPARMPDWSAVARQLRSPDVLEALRRSRAWYDARSAPTHFPVAGVTHAQARDSVQAMLDAAEAPWTEQELAGHLADVFDAYESVGWDGRGTVLYTGYFSPEFRASAQRGGAYQHPIYARPADLVSDPITGAVYGQRLSDGSTRPYPTRTQLRQSGALSGLELAYLDDPLDAYTVEVNGSAALQMPDGSTMYVGHAGTNGRDYTSIGQALVQAGKLDANRLSLPALREYFQRNPEELAGYTGRNDRFVFFTEYPADDWPAGSLGFRVEPGVSLATDKAIFPRGGPVVVETQDPGWTDRLMVDQDTGGAIRAPGRADVYFGIGGSAERQAGTFIVEGRLIYLLRK